MALRLISMKFFGFIVLLLGVFMVKSGDAMMRNKVPIRGGGGGGPGLAGRVGGGGKSAWAHLEGADPETVKAAILSERPELKVHVVPHDGK